MSYTNPLAGLLNFVAGARKANKTPHEQKPTGNTRGERMVTLFKTIYPKASETLTLLAEPVSLRHIFDSEQIATSIGSFPLVPAYMAVPWFPEEVEARMTITYLENRRLVVDLTKDGQVNIYDRYEMMMMQDDSMIAEYAKWFILWASARTATDPDQTKAN